MFDQDALPLLIIPLHLPSFPWARRDHRAPHSAKAGRHEPAIFWGEFGVRKSFPIIIIPLSLARALSVVVAVFLSRLIQPIALYLLGLGLVQTIPS